VPETMGGIPLLLSASGDSVFVVSVMLVDSVFVVSVMLVDSVGGASFGFSPESVLV